MMDVNCGRCLGCRTKQARDWSFRIMHEAALQDSYVIGLTYEKLPPNGSLVPKDLQDWMKRLRRKHKGRISYYSCGEYGDESERPHYHAIVMGKDLFLDREEIGRRKGYKVYQSDTLDKTWTLGHTDLEALGYGAAAYVAGYVRKKVSKLDSEDHYSRYKPDTGEVVEIAPEFSRMSRRPAIGKKWIQKFWRDVYPRDFVPSNGFEFRPPRYYDRWMMRDHSQDQDNTCTDCREHLEVMIAVKEKRWEERYEMTPQELASKEKAHKAKVNLFQKRDAL